MYITQRKSENDRPCMDWAWRQVLEQHGWKQSQCDGAWIRERFNRVNEIVNGPYIPRYSKEVNRLRQLNCDMDSCRVQ